MPDTLRDTAQALARALADTTGVAIAVSDREGKVLARTGLARDFCPLLARDETRGAPLPPRCEECPRVAALLAHAHDRLPPCPHGVDAVQPVKVGGELVAWVSTAVLPREYATAALLAEPALRLAALPIAEVVASARRERRCRVAATERLLEARIALERARARTPAGSPGREEIDAARAAIDRAFEAVDALRAHLAPQPAARVPHPCENRGGSTPPYS